MINKRIEDEWSGMDFSPLLDCSRTFDIEKSNFRVKTCGNPRTVEFVKLLDSGVLLLIEAKKTIARRDEEKSNLILRLKANETIAMLVSKSQGVVADNDEEFPSCMNRHIFCGEKTVFLLVIKGIPLEECALAKEALNRMLKPLIKIWGIKVDVWNEEKAKEKGFVA